MGMKSVWNKTVATALTVGAVVHGVRVFGFDTIEVIGNAVPYVAPVVLGVVGIAGLYNLPALFRKLSAK